MSSQVRSFPVHFAAFGHVTYVLLLFAIPDKPTQAAIAQNWLGMNRREPKYENERRRWNRWSKRKNGSNTVCTSAGEQAAMVAVEAREAIGIPH